MQESLEFYNKFGEKLIKDYVFGNDRLVSAIKCLASFIPEKSSSILDIGCGLGWSSYEFAKSLPETHVYAVDLSPVLIDTASKLFGELENLTFTSYDLTQGLPDKLYDAIVMIDVYEHIPFNERKQFHKTIKKILAPQGRLMLACPSKYHQDYLKKNDPKGLQPVDEDVDFDTICEIANDIDGELIFFEYQNIWNNYDYLYATIEIDPQYGNSVNGLKGNAINLESRKEREFRVRSKLDIHFKQGKREKKNKSLNKMWKRVINKIR